MARKEKDSEDTGKRHTCCGTSWYNFELHAKFNHWQLPIHIEFPLSSIASSDTLSVCLSSTLCLQPAANRFSGTGLLTRYLSQVIRVYYCSTTFFAVLYLHRCTFDLCKCPEAISEAGLLTTICIVLETIVCLPNPLCDAEFILFLSLARFVHIPCKMHVFDVTLRLTLLLISLL